jgi:opine dehydrogenase
MAEEVKTVVAAALGECVHIAGVMNFLQLAEAAGWRTVFLGPAVPIADVLAAARREQAALIAVSYRLTPETGERLLAEFAEAANEAIHNQPGYYGIKAPSTLNHRYIFEDVPMSLVPIASLGQHYGVSVRGMDSIIRLACIVHRTDYWRRGRTLDKLGIGGLSVSELTRYVNEGQCDGYTPG